MENMKRPSIKVMRASYRELTKKNAPQYSNYNTLVKVNKLEKKLSKVFKERGIEKANECINCKNKYPETYDACPYCGEPIDQESLSAKAYTATVMKKFYSVLGNLHENDILMHRQCKKYFQQSVNPNDAVLDFISNFVYDEEK